SNNIDTYNLYSYVENNFVNKFDENGNFAIPLVYVGYYALGMLAAYTVAKLAPEAIRTSVAVAGSIVNTLEDAVANIKEKTTEKADIKSVTKTFDNKIKKGGKTYI
ncbi:MAG: hypothetical protein K2G03_06600, partial [Bacilli bacterium]|nr:hypothetical protein [Bacilli bacterium]